MSTEQDRLAHHERRLAQEKETARSRRAERDLIQASGETAPQWLDDAIKNGDILIEHMQEWLNNKRGPYMTSREAWEVLTREGYELADIAPFLDKGRLDAAALDEFRDGHVATPMTPDTALDFKAAANWFESITKRATISYDSQIEYSAITGSMKDRALASLYFDLLQCLTKVTVRARLYANITTDNYTE